MRTGVAPSLLRDDSDGADNPGVEENCDTNVAASLLTDKLETLPFAGTQTAPAWVVILRNSDLCDPSLSALRT
jgi:hypothetical protein